MDDATREFTTPRRAVAKTKARKPDLFHLSFVATGDQSPACFWNVAATGDYAEECEIGRRLALEYLALEAAEENGMGHLPKIVADMPRDLTGVEIAFLATVARAAGAAR